MKDNIEFAEAAKCDHAWFPKFCNANEILHYHRNGSRCVVGFTNRGLLADPWLRRHYPEEKGKIRMVSVAIEVAEELWMPGLMVIKRMDLDLDLEQIREWEGEAYG